jgi:hypothetical protein
MAQYRLGVKRDFTGVHANRDSDLGGFLAGNMHALLSKVPQEALSGACEGVTVMSVCESSISKLSPAGTAELSPGR